MPYGQKTFKLKHYINWKGVRVCECAGVGGGGSEWNLAVHLCLNSNIDMRTLGAGVQAGKGVGWRCAAPPAPATEIM